jgi:hypothetical protein
VGRVAEVIDSTRVEDEGAKLTEVTIDGGGGNNFTAQLSLPPGEDSLPLDGDYAFIDESDDATETYAAGFFDPKLEPKAEKGEKRLFARSALGVVVGEVFFKRDGTVTIKNQGGTWEMAPNGDVTLSGNLKVLGEVTAKAESAPVNLSTHLHPTGVGPTSAPTPGT